MSDNSIAYRDPETAYRGRGPRASRGPRPRTAFRRV